MPSKYKAKAAPHVPAATVLDVEIAMFEARYRMTTVEMRSSVRTALHAQSELPGSLTLDAAESWMLLDNRRALLRARQP